MLEKLKALKAVIELTESKVGLETVKELIMEIEDVADRIVAELFQNGFNQKAKRLVLELEDNSNGGGWGKKPVKDIIIKHLKSVPTETEVMPKIAELVNKFLAWELPKSVCSDGCVTNREYPHSRTGTNLLTADEAKQMIEYLFSDSNFPE
jgi:hypothetical protein